MDEVFMEEKNEIHKVIFETECIYLQEYKAYNKYIFLLFNEECNFFIFN